MQTFMRIEFSTGIGYKAARFVVLTELPENVLEELRALYLRAEELAITWTMAVQAAKALRDLELLMLATQSQSEPAAEAKWFTTRIKTGAPQALVVG